MKKIFIAMAALAALVFTSCDKKETVVIRLDETVLSLVKGSTKQLKATVIPADDNASFEWFSSMPEYVSVSETGLVKAEKLYYKSPTDTDVTPVSIYCKYNGGAAECKVAVTPLAVKSISFDARKEGDRIEMSVGEDKTLMIKFEPENADVDYSKLEWETNAFDYVSVQFEQGNPYAVIKAVQSGSAEITAKYSPLDPISVYVRAE